MKYKYVHLMLHNGKRFNYNLVSAVHTMPDVFDEKEHCFVTPHQELYDEIKDFGQTILDKRRAFELINAYGGECEWLFVHSMCPPIQLLKVKRKYIGKICWRTWGHDVGYIVNPTDSFVKKCLKKFLTLITLNRYRNMKLIGTGNYIDTMNVRQKLGCKQKAVRMPYLSEKTDIARIVAELPPEKTRDEFNILIEHSGNDENQIEILEKLGHLKNEKIHAYLVLSYGNAEYIQKVSKWCSENWKDKATVITEPMAYSDYVSFLRGMDAAVFERTESYALGNISLLVYFHKKIYLNEAGIIHRGFVQEQVPHCLTKELEGISFEELTKPLDFEPGRKYPAAAPTFEDNINAWKEIFRFLGQDTKEGSN